MPVLKRLLSRASFKSLSVLSERQDRPFAALDLSLRLYWVLSAATISAYLLLWIINVRYLYGWNNDDWPFYSKALSVVMDWKNAFRGGFNFHQPYYFIASYLPLKLGISLPSFPLSGLEAQTGQYRWYLLNAVFLHAPVLAVWAWFASKITTSRLVAFLSLLLFATSPSFVLWGPQMMSRLFGLPFALLALWLLLKLDPESGSARRREGVYFLAGSIFWLAQGVNYTSLYLILPVCVVFWGMRLWLCWWLGRLWFELFSFVVGCLWLQGVMEAIGYFLVGTPGEKGPTMSLLTQFTALTLSLSVLDRLSMWSGWLRTLMGLPMLLSIAIGLVIYVKSGNEPGAITRFNRLTLGLSMLAGLIFLGLWRGMPFFRQTTVLQPFLFLFAGLAVVHVANRLAGRAAWLFANVVLLLVVTIGAIPWIEAAKVFEGHLGYGRSVVWAYTHKGERPLEWMTVYNVTLPFPEDLQNANPDSFLITFFPHLVWSSGRADLLAYLADTSPLASYPGLWGTESVHAENAVVYSPREFRFQPVMSEARVYRVGDLQAQMLGKPLVVQSVTADSTQSAAHEGVNVFDRGRSPDGITAWVSSKTVGMHHLEIEFAQAVELGEMRVILPAPLANPEISSIEIQTAADGGHYTSAWKRNGLEKYQFVAASWQPKSVKRIRVVVYGGNGTSSIIEEIVFPGYEVIAPLPSRTFPELKLSALQPNDQGFLASGVNITSRTVLTMDGLSLPCRYSLPSRYGNWTQVIIPEKLKGRTRRFEGRLTDGIRHSNVINVQGVGNP